MPPRIISPYVVGYDVGTSISQWTALTVTSNSATTTTTNGFWSYPSTAISQTTMVRHWANYVRGASDGIRQILPTVRNAPPPPPPLTPQEQRQIDAAERRARDLLLSCLTEAMRKLYAAENKILVASNKGRIFEIRHARMHNVFLLDEHMKRVEEWCVTLVGAKIPIPDIMLSQKLMLETNEDDLRIEANVKCLRTGRGLHYAKKQFDWDEQPVFQRLLVA